MATYREDEIQALITLAELSYPFNNPNNNSYKPFPKTISEARTYFRRFAVDLSDAFNSLYKKGIIQNENDNWLLTATGKDIAIELRRLRPPIYYWYKDFYNAIEKSQAFSEYSRQVFGENLGQHGFSDLNQIHMMLDILKPDKSSQVLDIGCGNGKIAEYISDLTLASVTGIDYIPEAIEQALIRTQNKRDRLQFRVCNLEDMDFKNESFDCIISIDSIYFGNAKAILAKWKQVLKHNGRMGIFYLSMDGSNLSVHLDENELPYKVYDISKENYELHQLKYKIVSELREAFEEEGNTFIWQNLITESVSSLAPYDPATSSIRRYLYYVVKSL